MKPEEAQALLIFKDKQVSERWASTLRDIGISKIAIVETPGLAIPVLQEIATLDVVLSDSDLNPGEGAILSALAMLSRYFPDSLIKILTNGLNEPTKPVQKSVLAFVQARQTSQPSA